jgi:protease-4
MADDPEIDGLLLVVRSEPADSLAHAEELADAIRGLRARGKKVICHLEDAGGRALHVCSQADRTVMNPAGGLRFAGLSSRYLYFGGILDKLGVKADFVRIGSHKLAAEQFTDGSTDIGKLDHEELLHEFEKIYLSDIGGGRRIPMGELKKRIAKGPFIAPEAKAAGLVDGLAYEDELDRVVEEVFGRPVKIRHDDPLDEAPRMWSNTPKVAIVYLHGDMIDGESMFIPVVGVRLAGSRTVAKALRTAREDPSVKAVVFRIETGGGSSLAADVILREAKLTAEKKPLVVSMGTSAASGGYYVAVEGNPIFANRSTITGSIGIFYGKVDVTGLAGKLGVGVELFRTAPKADAESFFRPFTDDERKELGVKVKQFYDLFVGRVSEGRGMTPEAVDRVARGKIWLGSRAVGNGLVDKIGGLREAITEARLRGKLPMDSPVLELPEDDESLLGLLLNLAGMSAQGSAAAMAAMMIPAEMIDFARALAPFVVYAPNQPLARAELFESITFGTTPRYDEP